MIESKAEDALRLVTFNVNGVRTIFQHYPFSKMNNSLNEVFSLFQSDVITMQELKTDTKNVSKWGKVDGFHSFISLPLKRTGYSGVGCWVRIPKLGDPLYDHLQVVKAEEGVTGLLPVRPGGKAFRDTIEGIGGYDGLDITDDKKALQIDSEGRCVIVELASNIVIFSTYCPANSSQTEEGERGRLLFLKLLFKRVRNLHEMGKHLVLMGDINVCRDLIDHASSLDQMHITLSKQSKGSYIEDMFQDACIQFIMDPVHTSRRLLNTMLRDSIIPQFAEDGILLDSTRKIQGRDRLKMYTVWNTLLNTRPVNYGSRIDFIFTTKDLEETILDSNIWPDVMGSDHCPVFTDLKIINVETLTGPFKVPRFEATNRYSLNKGNILDMFRKVSKSQSEFSHSPDTDNKISKQRKSVESSNSKVLGSHLENALKPLESPRHLEICNESSDSSKLKNNKPKPTETHRKAFQDLLGHPPTCDHGEDAILRTSKTEKSLGRKFWVCKRSQGGKDDPEASCGFFQWI